MSRSVAIVTGASSGIGKATALRLARDFGAIALAARSGEKLGEVGQQVKAIGAEALVLELDLMAPTAAEIIVKKTLDRFGRIDALVNIAVAVTGLDVFQMTDEQWNTGMELKFHGARRLTIRAWDALRGFTQRGFAEGAQGHALPVGRYVMCFRGGCGRGVEISADWARNVLLLPDRLSETRSAGSREATIPVQLQRNDDFGEVGQT
jgi:NAD(P)-dependent dehydrogenase (short-subunit alcohol dehydrogenase family)